MSPLKIFAWTNPNLPTVAPMVRVDHYAGDPVSAAAQAAATLKTIPLGQRCLQGWWDLLTNPATNQTAETLPSDIPGILNLLRSGPDISIPQKWTRKFYEELYLNDIIPDYLADDWEGGVSYWSSVFTGAPGLALIQAIYADATLAKSFTPAMKAHTPADFVFNTPNWHAAVLALNSWLAGIFAPALKKTVVDTAAGAFGQAIPASNFDDVIQSFQLYDANGWERATGSLAGWASPACYISPGQRHQGAKNAWWNAFLDAINAMRSCAGATANLSPWVSYPSYAGDNPVNPPPQTAIRWLWAQLMQHLRGTGVQTVLWWNPVNTTSPDGLSDYAFAGGVFDALAKAPASRLKLPALAMDSDSVTTAGLTTTYAQFAAFK